LEAVEDDEYEESIDLEHFKGESGGVFDHNFDWENPPLQILGKEHLTPETGYPKVRREFTCIAAGAMGLRTVFGFRSPSIFGRHARCSMEREAKARHQTGLGLVGVGDRPESGSLCRRRRRLMRQTGWQQIYCTGREAACIWGTTVRIFSQST
jgi:hypothetical protein